MLKIWLLFLDLKWIKICFINDNQWIYHIDNPYKKTISPQPPPVSASLASLASSTSISSNINSKIPSTPPSTIPSSASSKGTKNGIISNNNQSQHDRTQNLNGIDEQAELHPNVEKVNSNLAQNNNNVSWFVKYRQSLGNIHYIYKYFIVMTITSIILSM